MSGALEESAAGSVAVSPVVFFSSPFASSETSYIDINIASSETSNIASSETSNIDINIASYETSNIDINIASYETSNIDINIASSETSNIDIYIASSETSNIDINITSSETSNIDISIDFTVFCSSLILPLPLVTSLFFLEVGCGLARLRHQIFKYVSNIQIQIFCRLARLKHQLFKYVILKYLNSNILRVGQTETSKIKKSLKSVKIFEHRSNSIFSFFFH